MYEVKVLEEAEKVIKKWKKSNVQTFTSADTFS